MRMAQFRAEVTGSRRVRPCCQACMAPHPQAGEPPEVEMPKGMRCHACGTPATPPGPLMVSRPTLTLPWTARALLALGNFFARFTQ